VGSENKRRKAGTIDDKTQERRRSLAKERPKETPDSGKRFPPHICDAERWAVKKGFSGKERVGFRGKLLDGSSDNIIKNREC